jgi:uncharacterized membrane protein YraQ (UPF0718 family)
VDSVAVQRVEDFILSFTGILYEAMPFIVLGAVIAGLLEELLPQKLLTRILPRNRTLAIALGACLGLLFPMCECGIIPVMRRLLRKGLPLSCCVAYLLAGPVINVVVLLSTYFAFATMETSRAPGGELDYQMGGLHMVCFRAGMAYVVAFVTAHVVEWQHRKYGNKLLMPLAIPSKLPQADEQVEPDEVHRSFWQRLSSISETALHDFVDITVFLILGAALAALTRQIFTVEQITNLSRDHVFGAIGLMMGLAIILSLCSEADAFVAASFATLRPSAKLAFLVLGPMMDCKLYLMYTRIFRPRLIWTIILTMAVQVFVYSYLVHLLWEYLARNYPQSLGFPANG